MCGITGLATAPGGVVKMSSLNKMTTALAHRGPDGEGSWFSSSGRVGLGHRRLSIIDLSNAGAQPMASQSGRYVLSFNGEVYNYKDLQREIVAAGYSLRGQSDTETIVAGCDLWGIQETIRRMAGMFSMAIWDEKEQELVLARDRIGIKPLYYGMWDG